MGESAMKFKVKREERRRRNLSENNAFAWPPHRIDLADRVRGPDAGWDIGHQEVPGQQRQMGFGRGLAVFLRLLRGVPPTFIDDRFWDSRRHETRGHPRVFPQANSAL